MLGRFQRLVPAHCEDGTCHQGRDRDGAAPARGTPYATRVWLRGCEVMKGGQVTLGRFEVRARTSANSMSLSSRPAGASSLSFSSATSVAAASSTFDAKVAKKPCMHTTRSGALRRGARLSSEVNLDSTWVNHACAPRAFSRFLAKKLFCKCGEDAGVRGYLGPCCGRRAPLAACRATIRRGR